MATSLAPPVTFSSFANVSTAMSLASCGPCTSMQIVDLWRGAWEQKNASLPALRTIQPVIDPADNTTSTSISCNSAALPAYSGNKDCENLSLNGDCELVCVDYGGRQSGIEEPYTITLTGTSGAFLQWGSYFRIEGAMSTTDSNGSSTCVTSGFTVEQDTFTYSGPTIQTRLDTSWGLIMMPDLTSYYPDEGAFAQCKYFQTGPPPVALTAANEIVLPAMTLPGSSPATTQTPTSPSTLGSTTAQPASNEVTRIPSRTSVSQIADATPSTSESDSPEVPPQPSDNNEEQGSSPTAPGTTAGNDRPATTGDVEPATSPTVIIVPGSQGENEAPTNTNQSPEQDGTTNTEPTRVDPVPTATISNGPPPVIIIPESQGENEAPTNTNQSPDQNGATNTGPTRVDPVPTATISNGPPPVIALPSAPSQDDESSPGGVVVGGSTTIVAGGQVAVGSGTTFSVLPSSSGIVAIADGQTTTLALPTPAPAPVTDFVRPVTSAGQGFVVPGPVITEGGEEIIISGTSYVALPSGSGVVVVGDAGPTTLAPSQLSDYGISTVSGSPDQYAFGDQTLAVGGSGIVVAGATYSALPQGSGIGVAASGSSSVIAVAEATNVPGLGDVEILDEAEGAYILDGSVTVVAGGAAATISNTVYSALPSGFGVLVSANSAADDFAAYIEQGLSGSDSGRSEGESYIIGAKSQSGEGNSVTTVSGVVYLALPSGSGILVVASGRSTTIGFTTTGDDSSSTATSTSSGDDTAESVTAFTGASPPSKYYNGMVAWGTYLGLLGVLGACLVL